MGREAALISTADTNILLRAVLQDDSAQGKAAGQFLAQSAGVTVGLASWCEFVWVMSSGYKLSRADIAEQLRALLDAQNIIADRDAVERGLRFLEAGGDFADGIIAEEGQRLGAQEFVSFDKTAVRVARDFGMRARLPEST